MQTHDSDSSASETTLRRGIAAARAGLRSVAAAQFERAAESSPDDPNVWLWLAWVANSPDNVIRCLERVLDLSPGHAAATAGLTWARCLSQDVPTPVAFPISVTVAESLAPIVTVSEPESTRQESVATSVDIEPAADVASETRAEPASETVTVPRLDAAEEATPIAESNELPNVPVPPVSAPLLDDSPNREATHRRWNDLVQHGTTSSTDAVAWPSLVPPPLPSLIPPPLPAVAVSAPVEREPIAPARFQGLFAANSVASAVEPTKCTALVQQASTDVESIANSFNPPMKDNSADKRPLVMVVDDSPTVRKLVSLTLERRGYRVVCAFDGVAAIKELGSCRPDLILLDINMPRLDGYRLCKLIKKHEATQAIPVVMLSGKDGMFDKLRGRLVGCSDYITKPFEADALTLKVAKYLTTTSSSL